MVYPLDGSAKINSLPDEVTFADLAEAVKVLLPTVSPLALPFPPRVNNATDDLTVEKLAAYYKQVENDPLPSTYVPNLNARVNDTVDLVTLLTTASAVQNYINMRVTLLDLTLDTPTISEDSVQDDVVAAIGDYTAGSTLTLLDDAGGRFAISGHNIVRGATALDYATLASHDITIQETLAGAINDPHETVLAIAVTPSTAVTLSDLTLSAAASLETSVQGDAVGALQGITPGSTLSLTNTAGGRFALNGSQIVRGATALDYASASSHQITVRETNSGAGAPHDTVLTINVTQVIAPIALNAPTISSAYAYEGSAPGTIVGLVQGLTAGSSLALTNNAGNRFALNGSNQIVLGATALDYNTAQSHDIQLTETLVGAVGSPRVTTLTINVTHLAGALPAAEFGKTYLASKAVAAADGTPVLGLPPGMTAVVSGGVVTYSSVGALQ